MSEYHNTYHNYAVCLLLYVGTMHAARKRKLQKKQNGWGLNTLHTTSSWRDGPLDWEQRYVRNYLRTIVSHRIRDGRICNLSGIIPIIVLPSTVIADQCDKNAYLLLLRASSVGIIPVEVSSILTTLKCYTAPRSLIGES